MSPSPVCLVDWKSGAFRSLEERLQLGGYFGCRGRLVDGQLLPLEERVASAHIVHVWEGGCTAETSLPLAECETAYQKFLEAKDLFDWLVAQGGARVPENEAYRVNGRYYPSVTYILQHVIAKPNLMNWAYEMGVGAGVWTGLVGGPAPDENVDYQKALEVKRQLDAKTMKRTDPEARPWLNLLKFLDSAGMSATARRDGRAGQGTTIHKTILFYLQGNAVNLAEAPGWLSSAVAHFAAWAGRVQLKAAYLEQKLVNEEHGYAGTCDFLGWASLTQPTTTEEVAHVAS